MAECRYALGLALARTDRTSEALDQFDQALEIFQEGGRALGEGLVHFQRARILLTTGSAAQAAQEAEQALAIFRRVGGDRRRADVLSVLGDAMAGMKRQESARAHTCWAEALAIYETLSDEESTEQRARLEAKLNATSAHGAGSRLRDRHDDSGE